MNNGQRTIAALLSVIAALLIVIVVVVTTDEAQAQTVRGTALGGEGDDYLAGGATQIMNSGSSSPKWRFWRMTRDGEIDMALVEFTNIGQCDIEDICVQYDLLCDFDNP